MSWACNRESQSCRVHAVKTQNTHRLVMGETESGEVFVLEGKLLKVLNDLGELGKDEIECALLEDQVGVIGN